jgi:hypothetical protein
MNKQIDGFLFLISRRVLNDRQKGNNIPCIIVQYSLHYCAIFFHAHASFLVHMLHATVAGIKMA